VGKGNKENQGSFQNINFFEIFDAMDEYEKLKDE